MEESKLIDRLETYHLLQSTLNSPHAYNQNKAFTKHIVDTLMQSYDEKLNLEVSIPRKLYDEWEPTIKIKIKDHECYALCRCQNRRISGWGSRTVRLGGW